MAEQKLSTLKSEKNIFVKKSKLQNFLLQKGYEMDLLVDESVIVEVKSIAAIAPIHEAQLLTYMRLRHVPVGLLLNFNEIVLKDGIRRKILDFE